RFSPRFARVGVYICTTPINIKKICTFASNMGRRIPQDKRFITDVQIIDIAEEGKGVAKHDELVMFIERAVPGDVADVELFRKKKSFAEGRLVTLKEPSKYRIDPFCPHFGVCGGC